MSYPQQRCDGLSMQEIGTEMVLFNQATGDAVCLNASSAAVWKACNGQRSLQAIAEVAGGELGLPLPEEVVRYALVELRQKGLLVEEFATPEVEAAMFGQAMTRRQLVQRLGVQAAVLLPIVGLVATPRKAHAVYGCVLGDTLVQLADGSALAASALQAGMWLEAFDPDSGEARYGEISHIVPFPAPAIHTLFTERGDVLQASSSHLLITAQGDVHGTRMSTLQAGDSLMVLAPGQREMVSTRVTGVQISVVPQTVYGVEMKSKEHTLVTAGLVSHNMPTKQ